tara:strand:+ start:77 stop:562 length:486 start_codon:yes stop_codon:yes gene_type:complete
MSKHSFVYSIVEEFVKIDEETLNKINKIKLKKDNNIPDMNLTSYYNRNTFFDNFIKDKLNNIFKKYNLTLGKCWVQKYLKNNYHSLHTHNVLEKSFVWFIQGNKNSSPLYFYDVGYPVVNTNQSIKIDFVPGTLVIFPGFIPHEVRPNKNNNRLIVSGNVI